MFENIDKSKRKEIRIRKRAETDPLTGLLNRNTFKDKLNSLLKQRKENSLFAFILLDIDGFKQVNDTFGHAEGDKLLIETGKAICSVLRDYDLVGRLGGDEFIICLSNVPERDIINKRAGMIWQVLHKSFDDNVLLSSSVGIAICPDDGCDFDTLYRKADKALYQIKENGKDDFGFYCE